MCSDMSPYWLFAHVHMFHMCIYAFPHTGFGIHVSCFSHVTSRLAFQRVLDPLQPLISNHAAEACLSLLLLAVHCAPHHQHHRYHPHPTGIGRIPLWCCTVWLAPSRNHCYRLNATVSYDCHRLQVILLQSHASHHITPHKALLSHLLLNRCMAAQASMLSLEI